MKKSIFPVLVILFSLNLQAQNIESSIITPTDSLNNFIVSYLENNDVGFLWEGSISQDERLGIIGENFQRIQIHFNSIIQNYDNPFEYFIYGKSKVKENICEFQGSLIISETSYLKDDDNPDINTAYIAGNYAFFEDPACLHSGIFRGEFITFIYVGKDETLYYNDIDNEKPGFSNNLFTGDWFHYESDLVQICNWGDKRIPGSADLDVGSEHFKPSFRFLENGWSDYLKEKEKANEDGIIKWWE